MARLHLKYRNIRPGVVQATRDFLSERPSQLGADDQARLAQVLADEICGEYGVDAPAIIVPAPWASAGWEYERPSVDSLGDEIAPARIHLRSFSVFTLLSGIARHLNELRQFQFAPRAFAASTFYLAAPSTFRKAVRSGRIAGLTARDTFTAESWQKFVNYGLAAGNGNFTESLSNSEIQSVLEGTYVSDLYEGDEDDYEDLEVFADPNYSEPTAIVPDAELEEVLALPADELDGLNRDALRRLAADLNIPGRGRMLAPALRTAIREAQTV